jgi:hypothetical protein
MLRPLPVKEPVMNPHTTSKPAFRRKVLGGLLLPLLVAAGAAGAASPSSASAAAAPTGPQPARMDGAHCCAARPVYSVINLAPEDDGRVFLNEKGQAAFSAPRGAAGFFDGDRLHDMGVLREGTTGVTGLNNRGVVVGIVSFAVDPFADNVPFTWTVAGGYRELPGPPNGRAWAINDRNQVVGSIFVPGIPFPATPIRAVRWDPNGRIVPLGPVPETGGLSDALTINNRAIAGGMGVVASGELQAALWDPAGRQLNLGGDTVQTRFVNEKSDAAGYFRDATGEQSGVFFRGAHGPVVPTGARGPLPRVLTDLNDRGEVVGNTSAPGGTAAYLWSRARGLVLLPRGSATRTDVSDVNNRTEMAGQVELNGAGPRAALWRGLTVPLDLNGVLYRRPAGLVLDDAVAINDAGTILARSNAGLVMLRPGTAGTDAPVLGPIKALPDSVVLGQEVSASLGFIDSSRIQYHTAVAQWSDGCVSPHPLVRESRGVGEVLLKHRFCAPGIVTLTLLVTDSGGRTTETRKRVVVNTP